MTIYQKKLAERAPELDPVHMETLALDIGSILNGMPAEFFDDVVVIARQMGPKRLAARHAQAIA